ncbi:uncharacterized protein EV420DRAFT_1513130 [Desarmillaria tabescens]|uniref:LIM zinc-binding domain-containing protein n=1 Tax=Armillaria tabescens TaxID=1929756 RepID=A0AA39NGF3_ARMTA|nr:uncharacterized protein EV420DRAFT_1513130 [Desarmillaria tabescens]KAK0465171.1 hypothetical protein EV420DRAFT_1513130 [Desarmillaria tabescens]
MGFCRRCGDIVAGTRCKCGGTAVAPAVAWNPSSMKEGLQDRWSNTYVTKDRPPPGPLSPNVTGSSSKQGSTVNDGKRFPQPTSSTPLSSTSALATRVSEHIASTTSQLGRPSSPLKQSVAAPEADILPSPLPFDNSLSKVYGSVLQPKETLNTHSCSICSSIFPPDATIYPDPSKPDDASSGFLCRSCYTTNGGSKGICPTCSRPVLALKSEGGFICADGKYWHKRSCFICQGCFKNVGHAPMVDLLGRPTCAECFENCLKRDRTPKKSRDSISSSPMSNLGGMNVNSKNRSREGSPAIEELEQRLGIRSREASPSMEDSFSRSGLIGSSPSPRPRPSSAVSGSPSFHSLSPVDRLLDQKGSPSPSPRGKYDRFKNAKLDSHRSIDLSPSFRPITSEHSPSRLAGPDLDAVQEMKNRFLSSDNSPKLSSPSPPLKHARSSGSFSNLPNSSPKNLGSFELPSTPDLLSDVSDAGTFSSSGPDSPPRNDLSDLSIDRALSSNRRMHKYASRYSRADAMEPDDGHTGRDQIPVPHRLSTSNSPKPLTVTTNQVSQSTVCAKCSHPLFSIHGGGRFVTVPNADDGTSQTFHADCFTCAICDLPFREASQGQAVFVKTDSGACHVECAPTKIITRTISTPSPSRPAAIKSTSSSSSPRHQAPTSSSPRHQTSASSSPKPQSGTATYGSSSRYERPPLTALATSLPASFPRFGSSTSCPGCRKSVSPMERGVVPGPQGTRWHAPCLVCGGKKETKGYARFRDEKKKDEPGCGKRLDSAAKTDGEGGVWCRECLLLLSNEPRASPHGSPTRPLSMSSFGDGLSKLLPQNTGTTTIARQFTGLGAGGPNDGSLRRQLTGGALGPTRSLSPTKQIGVGMRPRPKSVIGMRSSKSVDEGRGMFLVRQMTGSGAC